MSSTTRAATRAVRIAAVSIALVSGWTSVTCLALLVSERADAVGVVFTRPAGTFDLPRSVAVLDWDGHFGRFVGRSPGYVADLYRAGAIGVVPVRARGCLALSRGAGKDGT